MRVFHGMREREYHPRHSFFCGRFTPYPDVPARSDSILAALEGIGGIGIESPPPPDFDLVDAVHDQDYVTAITLKVRKCRDGFAVG